MKLYQNRYVRVTLYLTPDEYEYLNAIRGNKSWKEFAFEIELKLKAYRKKPE